MIRTGISCRRGGGAGGATAAGSTAGRESAQVRHTGAVGRTASGGLDGEVAGRNLSGAGPGGGGGGAGGGGRAGRGAGGEGGGAGRGIRVQGMAQGPQSG